MTITLSARQRRILVLAANGHTNDAIATREGISTTQVNRHLQSAAAFFATSGRTHTVVHALLTGYLRPADIDTSGPTAFHAPVRTMILTEIADRLAADAEQGAKEGWDRIYQRAAARKVRAMADQEPPIQT